MGSNVQEKEGKKSNKYSSPNTKKDWLFATPSLTTTDKATKRVIAPYLKIIRRGQKVDKHKPGETNEQFIYYLQRKPSVLMRKLSAFLSDSVDLTSLLHETVDVLKQATNSCGVTLYLIDHQANEIYQSVRDEPTNRHRISYPIREGTILAASVALHKEFVMVDNIMNETKYPDGIGYKERNVKSVLCVPVVTPNNDCFAIIELYRALEDHPFESTELKVVIVVTGWMGAAIHQNQFRLGLQKQQELNDYLLDLTRCYFADTVALDKMISEVLNFAKETLHAEKGAFYIIEKDGDDLLAEVYDEGIDGEGTFHRKNTKKKINTDKSIAGEVANTGVAVNIKDANNDPRFDKSADQKSGYITKSLLCMPVMSIDGVLGAIQVMNKINTPCFTAEDENLLKTFAVYCSLSLHYFKLSRNMKKTADLHKNLLGMFHLQMKPCVHEQEYVYHYLVNDDEVPIPQEFKNIGFYITNEYLNSAPKLVLSMFIEILGDECMNKTEMLKMILVMRKMYRNNPYHNFEHAFNMTHAMYNIIRLHMHMFTTVEKRALLVAALGHDVDHRGTTNNFLQLTQDVLVDLYEESPLENHHFVTTMMILEDYQIFKTTSKNFYKKFTGEIHDAILATDLANYFRSRSKLIGICLENQFDFDNPTHRTLLKNIMMTCCDLSGQCKPFVNAKKITANVYKEFYAQGDIEKHMNVIPLSMMDRDKQGQVPADQIQFLTVVVLPCAELLKNILPNSSPFYEECLKLRDTWREINETRNDKVWRPDM